MTGSGKAPCACLLSNKVHSAAKYQSHRPRETELNRSGSSPIVLHLPSLRVFMRISAESHNAALHGETGVIR